MDAETGDDAVVPTEQIEAKLDRLSVTLEELRAVLGCRPAVPAREGSAG